MSAKPGTEEWFREAGAAAGKAIGEAMTKAHEAALEQARLTGQTMARAFAAWGKKVEQ
jgi:hypothetical protein